MEEPDVPEEILLTFGQIGRASRCPPPAIRTGTSTISATP